MQAFISDHWEIMVWGHEVHNNINKHKHLVYKTWLKTKEKRNSDVVWIKEQIDNFVHIYEQETDLWDIYIWISSFYRCYHLKQFKKVAISILKNVFTTFFIFSC
jgi:hypothetical protein